MLCRAAAWPSAAGSTGPGSGRRRCPAGTPTAAAKSSNPAGVASWSAWQGLGRADEEGVRDRPGQQDEVPGAGRQDLAGAAELDGAGQDVEHLVLGLVSVQRRREAGRVDEVRDRESAGGVRGGGLECHEVSEEPQGFALVVVQDVGLS
jgi:hypothetical protein